MNIEEAIKILDYKINMYKEDVFIGDLDKTNIEAIKKVLEEIERLKEEIKGYEQERERVLNIIDERNRKAIEYIENIQTPTYMTLEDICDLLDILKGVDKDSNN